MLAFLKALAATGAAVLTLLGAGAAAHHGFSGRYDRTAPIYLEGTVIEAYFGYPHAEVTLEADPAAVGIALPAEASAFTTGLTYWRDALGARPEIEFPPTRGFFDLDGRVRPGDRVAVVVLRNCEPPHQLRGQWISVADGSTVLRSGRVQDEVDGC